MNKDEILSKSREENKNEDERERQIRMKASIPAFIGMGVIGLTLMLLEMILLDTVILSRGIYLVFMGTTATQNWYLALTLKKKNYFVSAVCFMLCTVIAILQVIMAFRAMM